MKVNLRGGDLPLGLLLLGFALAAMWNSSELEFGTFTRMGPGFIPMVLAAALSVLALAILIKGLIGQAEPVSYAFKPLAIILAGLAFVAVALDHLGLVICIPVLVVVASMAQGRLAWKPVLALAAFLTVFCYVLFILALGLPIPAFPG